MTGNISKKRIVLIATLFFCCFFSVQLSAQDMRDLKISGVILDAESLEPVPFTSVILKDMGMGTVADNTGYFTLIAHPGDTISFRSVGYQERVFIIPSQLKSKTYTLIELMIRDNILLEEVVVYPLPDFDELARTVLKQDLTPDQQVRIKNFKQDLDNILTTQFNENSPYYEQWRYAKLYDMTGIVPPNNFINPMTWSNFIRDWKKNQDKR